MKEEVTIYELWAWVVVAKRTGEINQPGGIAFEREENKCPPMIEVNPIYSGEYENKRIKITYYFLNK